MRPEAHGDSCGPRTGHGTGPGRGQELRPLPLNSRKLTQPLLRQPAAELGVPRQAASGDVRLLIEAAITEGGREPQNVQVLIQDTGDGAVVFLQDADGVFLTAKRLELGAAETEPGDTTAGVSGGEGEVSVDTGLEGLREELAEVKPAKAELQAQVGRLEEQLAKEKRRTQELWKINCAQLTEFEDTLAEKDEEILALQESRVTTHDHTPPLPATEQPAAPIPVRRRGKAPPVDAFMGEDPEVRLDDWLPSLKHAAEWNNWEPSELLQLAGHLRGRALQEWNLLQPSERATYEEAVGALSTQLDPGGRTLAIQEFRHAAQSRSEGE